MKILKDRISGLRVPGTRWMGGWVGPALGPTQPHIQLVPGALTLGVPRPGREANHSPQSSAQVKNA
jgi:hypothetical protein